VLAETLVPKLDASVQGSFGWQGEMLDAVSLQGIAYAAYLSIWCSTCPPPLAI